MRLGFQNLGFCGVLWYLSFAGERKVPAGGILSRFCPSPRENTNAPPPHIRGSGGIPYFTSSRTTVPAIMSPAHDGTHDTLAGTARRPDDGSSSGSGSAGGSGL